MSLLTNGGFEAGTWRRTLSGVEYGEISVPLGWVAFWDPARGRPEMKVIPNAAPYLDPPRVSEGEQALQVFTFYRDHDAGVLQQVAVPAGATLKLSALAHAWYSQFDDSHLSQWEDEIGIVREIQDGANGMLLLLGIDPTGGTDWQASHVQWRGAHIYSGPSPIELTVPDCGATVTVFLRSLPQFPFKHCDVYWDDVRLEIVAQPQPQPEPVNYEVVVNLLPQTATKADKGFVLDQVHESRQTILQSADDAARLVAPGAGESRVKVWGDWPGIGPWLNEHGVSRVEYGSLPTEQGPEPDPEPEPTPDPTWTPKRYVPRGTVGGFCGSQGDLGQLNVAEALAKSGVPMPTAKLVVDVGVSALLKSMHPGIRIVGRKIDLPTVGNVEGFTSTRDPAAQADARMQALLPVMIGYPAVTYWEIVNEQDPPGAEGHAQLARFFLRAMQIANQYGIKLALFSYSVGVPEPTEWDAIAATGVFEAAAAGGHALALHEYGMVGEGSVIGRFQDVYNRHILPRRLNIPLFITEYGVRREQTHDPATVWSQFVQYERMCRALPYVAGVHAYIGPPADPDYFNAYTGIEDDFVEYARGVWIAT